MNILRDGLIFLSQNSAARTLVMNAPFSRSAARRFVAGESTEDVIRAAREINGWGADVTLDYLGESVSSREEARQAADVYLRVIDRIVTEGIRGNVSLKLTAMGQDIDEAFLRENIARVLDLAAEHDMFVRFDMESSEYTQRTIDFFRSLWDSGRRNIGLVLQSYLYRTEDDCRMANALGARVRLCKGAYKEPPEVAYPDKADVDANFIRCMQLLLSEGNYPGIATHDEAMLEATKRYARQQGIGAEKYEFQMLYGVRRDLQQQLVKEGYRLRVYVPFGEAWYPYLMRRMAERPANMFFIVNNVLRESPLGFMFRRK